MPDTQIFNGAFSNRMTAYGRINMESAGDTAFITFEDRNHNKTKATLKVYDLTQLTQSDLFKEAKENHEPELLVSTWFSKHNKNSIIKYAGKNQLAMVFSSEGDLQSDFKKVLQYDVLPRVGYVNETLFCKKLEKKTGLKLDALREIAGMDDDHIDYFLHHQAVFFECLDSRFTLSQLGEMEISRIELLLDNYAGLVSLFERGITHEQLMIVSLDKLTKYFNSDYKAARPLKLITIQQLLGLSFKPLVLDGIKIHGKTNSNQGLCSGSIGELTYKSTYNACVFVHKNKQTNVDSSLTITYGKINPFYLDQAERLLQAVSPLELVHDWYTLIERCENNKIYRQVYSPQMSYIFKESYDEAFPTVQLDKCTHIVSVKFYEELRFVAFLNQNEMSFKRFKNLPGMSLRKLEFLCDNLSTLKRFVDKGLRLEDCAKIAEKRLMVVMSNVEDAEFALEFVTIDELFCVPPPSPRAISGFFKERALEEESFEVTTSLSKSPKCRVM